MISCFKIIIIIMIEVEEMTENWVKRNIKICVNFRMIWIEFFFSFSLINQIKFDLIWLTKILSTMDVNNIRLLSFRHKLMMILLIIILIMNNQINSGLTSAFWTSSSGSSSSSNNKNNNLGDTTNRLRSSQRHHSFYNNNNNNNHYKVGWYFLSFFVWF